MFRRLWPHSLKGQVLLAIALALLLAQGFSAALLYRAQHERREAALVHNVAMRLFGVGRLGRMKPEGPPLIPPPGERPDAQPPRAETVPAIVLLSGEQRSTRQENQIRDLLVAQGIAVDDVAVVFRDVTRDPQTLRRQLRRAAMLGHSTRAIADTVMIAGVRPRGASEWMVVRMVVPPGEGVLLMTLVGQTLLIYAVLVGAIWLILRRITRPLAALTNRVARFADTRDKAGQIEPQGPDDVRSLIAAHNAMEGAIVALLDEKDVMLGAIGHDLKTPLAALRVRIESVEDETERARMATTIEDITRTLDDILSLARVGRPSDPKEATELSALVAALVEEYEDMGEPVTLDETRRAVMQVRPTWLRRALRNLIGNALRYGKAARVTLESTGRDVVIRIADDGPGIAEDKIGQMLEPFTRGDPSRNSETGGAGLGLTLARAVAEQHGGTLTLANRRAPDGAVIGLEAVLRLPL